MWENYKIIEKVWKIIWKILRKIFQGHGKKFFMHEYVTQYV